VAFAKRLGLPQQTISYHLPKMAELPFWLSTFYETIIILDLRLQNLYPNFKGINL